MTYIAIGITVLILAGIVGLVILYIWLLEEIGIMAIVLPMFLCGLVLVGVLIYHGIVYPWIMTWDVAW